MSGLDALLGKVQDNGTDLEIEGALNFKPPLSARRNVSTGAIDIESDTADLADVVEALAEFHFVEGLEVNNSSLGAQNATALQAAIDAASSGALLLLPEGDIYIDSPLRLIDRIGLTGVGSSSVIKKAPTWYAGPSIIIGSEQDAHPHAAAILDDADFSYEFTGSSPARWLNIGLDGGFMPLDWSAFSMEFPFAATSGPNGGLFFALCGGNFDVQGVNTYRTYLQWNGDGQHLDWYIKIGGVGHLLTTTTVFHTGLGTRHMLCLDYDGSTVRLFVDGVLEASSAATGVFTSDPWEVFTMGGAWTSLGEGSFQSSANFNCGGFSVSRASRHSINYTVSWSTPAADADSEIALICETAREAGDLIKLRSLSNGYAWMQTRSTVAGATTSDVTVEAMSFAGGVNARGVSILVRPCIRTQIDNIVCLESGVYVLGNSFYSRYGQIDVTGGYRYGSVFGGGVNTYFGRIKHSGAPIGCILSGSGKADVFHTYDYSAVGLWLNEFAGEIDLIGCSDEGLPAGTDPRCGLLIYGFGGYPSPLNLNSVDVNVLTSDVTIPIVVAQSLQTNLRIGGAMQLLPGATTPPPYVIELTTPTLCDPIYVDNHNQSGVALSNHPEKIITPQGPAYGVEFIDGDWDATITARQGLRFIARNTEFTADRAVTLSNEIATGIEVPDGTVIELAFLDNVTFGGYSITVKNHDGTDLHVHTQPGTSRYVYWGLDGNWVCLDEPAEYLAQSLVEYPGTISESRETYWATVGQTGSADGYYQLTRGHLYLTGGGPTSTWGTIGFIPGGGDIDDLPSAGSGALRTSYGRTLWSSLDFAGTANQNLVALGSYTVAGVAKNNVLKLGSSSLGSLLVQGSNTALFELSIGSESLIFSLSGLNANHVAGTVTAAVNETNHVTSEDVASAAATANIDIALAASTSYTHVVQVRSEDASGNRCTVRCVVGSVRSGSSAPTTSGAQIVFQNGTGLSVSATISSNNLRIATTNNHGADAHITTRVWAVETDTTVEDS